VRALLPGRTGFVGSHMAEHLIERGHKVVNVDDLSTGKRESSPTELGFTRQTSDPVAREPSRSSSPRPSFVIGGPISGTFEAGSVRKLFGEQVGGCTGSRLHGGVLL